MLKRLLPLLACLSAVAGFARADAGREGASFLDIPVGAEPAALGTAYCAVADNSNAMVYNPAGLAFADAPGLDAMHVSYVEDVTYNTLTGVWPIEGDDTTRAFGFGVQSLGSGDIDRRDATGVQGSAFDATFAAYSLAYAQTLRENWSLGFGAKMIREAIDDVSASAYAMDAGTTWHIRPSFSLAGAITNMGSDIKLYRQSDPLPTQARVGTAWRINTDWRTSADLIYRRNGPFGAAAGLEWSNSAFYALRAGYNTSRTKELGFLAGVTGGFALRYWGQEIAYAYVPIGDLGHTHYFSINLRFTRKPKADRAYPELPRKRERLAKEDFPGDNTGYTDYRNLYDILNESERRSLGRPKDSF